MNKIKQIIEKFRHIVFLDSRIVESLREREDELIKDVQAYKKSLQQKNNIIKKNNKCNFDVIKLLKEELKIIYAERDKLKKEKIQLDNEIKELKGELKIKVQKWENSQTNALKLKQKVIIELYEIIKANITDQSVIDNVNKKYCTRVYDFAKRKNGSLKDIEYQPTNINSHIIL